MLRKVPDTKQTVTREGTEGRCKKSTDRREYMLPSSDCSPLTCTYVLQFYEGVGGARLAIGQSGDRDMCNHGKVVRHIHVNTNILQQLVIQSVGDIKL